MDWKVYTGSILRSGGCVMPETRYSLCPNCDACPEVVIAGDVVTIGEAGNQVRLTPLEWNVLVNGVKDGVLGLVKTAGDDQDDAICLR